MGELLAGRYAIIDDVHRSGGLSSVKKAVDTRDGSFVAIKFVNGNSDDHLLNVCFEREVGALKDLADHPNIVRIKGWGTDETETRYIVLEWLEHSLHDLIHDRRNSTWNEFYETIGEPLLAGLEFMHLKDHQHRDIKPRNILLSDDGVPKFADFGIGKTALDQPPSDLTLVVFRSGPYSPPEEYESVKFVRDVFGLAVVFIQCMHSEQIEDYAQVLQTLPTIFVPPDVRSLLERCIAIDPGDRPPNGPELAEEFRRIMRHASSIGSRALPTVHLTITNMVRNRMIEKGVSSTPGECSGMITQDLVGPVFGRFQFDYRKGTLNRNAVELVGASYRYVVIPNDGKPTFSIVNFYDDDFETLEAIRGKAKCLDEFQWSVKFPTDDKSADQARIRLRESLEAFQEAIDSPGAALDPVVEEFFDTWSRVLDAREALERGTDAPVRYESYELSDREAEFHLAEPTEAELLGTEVDVIDPGPRNWRYAGVVVRQSTEKVKVRLKRAVRALPKSGTIAPSLGPSEVALRRQRNAILAVRDGTESRAALSRVILDPSSASAPSPLEITNWYSDLDSSKQDAVSAALGTEDVLLVHGPPGTGKTKMIVETVRQFLDRQPRAKILIVSQTHVAVDNALERLDEDRVNGLVRLGKTGDPRVKSTLQHLLLEDQIRRWAEAVTKRSERNIEALAGAEGIPPNHLRAALALRSYLHATERADDLRKRAHDANSGGTQPSEVTAALDLVEAEDGELEEQIARYERLRDEAASDARQHLAGDLTIGATPSPGEAAAASDMLIGTSPRGRQLLRLLELQTEWLLRISNTADAVIHSAYLETVSVLAGTCIGFLRNPSIGNVEYDLCILDEASKATATESLVPLVHARRWILVGDTRQLPPVDEELTRNQQILDENNITRGDVQETLFQRFADMLPERATRQLTDQYRMVRPIGDLISTCFYDGELRSPADKSVPGLDQLWRPITWIDTHSLGVRRRENAPGGSETSFANKTEAGIVVTRLRVLEGALAKGVIQPPNEQSLSVLVIAPYRSQVAELEMRIKREKLRHLDVSVQSVDAVQGREADVVVFSVTRSNVRGELGFLGQDYWRRINVALSRARYSLTIIGDADFCRSSPGALRSVLEYMKAHPESCDIRSAE